MESSSRPRRKHKLKHGASGKSNGSNNTPSSPQSPFVSPLRFAPKKSILRISSPKAAKSPIPLSRFLPLPLEDKTASAEMPWDENDEEYPEVPKTPTPQHRLKLSSSDTNNKEDESDGISSVSSGSKNGEIRIPRDDDTDDGEEWEFKQFTNALLAQPATSTAKKRRSAGKVGKLLGKTGKRLFKGVRKKRVSQESVEIGPPPPSSSLSSQQPPPSLQSSEQPQHQHQQSQSIDSQPESSQQQQEQRQPQQQQEQQTSSSSKPEPQPAPQQAQEEPEPLQPPTQPQSVEPPPSQSLQPPRNTAAPPKQQQAARKLVLSPIRIKRRKPPQPQSPDAESPRKAPRQILKGRHRNEAAPLRSDALWTQTIMTGNEDDNDSDNNDNENDKNDEELKYRGGDRGVETKQEEGPVDDDDLPKKDATTAEPAIRSDHLWAQNMMRNAVDDDGNPEEEASSVGLLTPEILSPKTPTAGTSTPQMMTSSSSKAAPLKTLSQIPFLNSDEEDEDENDNGSDNDSNDSDDEKDKMDTSTGRSTNHTDTTASEIPTITPAGSESGRIIENSDLEDGNIVDEDDLLELPSDEQDDDHDAQQEHNSSIVQERNTNPSDYYLRQVLSDDGSEDDDDEDEDDEGGVVSEHDEELILEEQQKQQRNRSDSNNSGVVDQEDVMLSDILSHDSNSALIDASDPEDSEDYIIPVASTHEDNQVLGDNFEIQVQQGQQGSSSNEHPPRELVGENLNTTINSNFSFDDSDLAEMEKKDERPAISIGQRSTLTNMQHRLLSMRTIKDTYKRKLLMQEQESVQLQVQLLASQYEAKEAKMSLQNAQAALLHEQAKLKASENERGHQKELLRNLQEQNSIVTAQLQKSKEAHASLARDAANSSFAGNSIESLHSHDMKLASMEEQLLVQDEEMDQLAAQIQELKSKTAQLEAAKGVAERQLKEALAREESLKAQLSAGTGQPMIDSEPNAGNGDDSDRNEIQRLQELKKDNEQRYETESASLRNKLENVQKEHELELAKLQEQIETNKKLTDSAAEEAEVSRKQLLQELAESKLQHTQAIEELKKSLSKTHQEEKSKLHTRYTNELERLEDEIEGSRSELSV